MFHLQYLFRLFVKCSAPLAICYKHLPRVNKGYLFLFILLSLQNLLVRWTKTHTDIINLQGRRETANNGKRLSFFGHTYNRDRWDLVVLKMALRSSVLRTYGRRTTTTTRLHRTQVATEVYNTKRDVHI